MLLLYVCFCNAVPLVLGSLRLITIMLVYIQSLMLFTVNDSRCSSIMIFLLGEWEINQRKKIWDPAGILRFKSQLNPGFFPVDLFLTLSAKTSMFMYIMVFHPHTTWLTQASYTDMVDTRIIYRHIISHYVTHDITLYVYRHKWLWL